MHMTVTMMRRRIGSSNSSGKSPTIGVLLLLLLLPVASANDFEPYQLNGGLLTGVASKDFVLIASDTRFAGEGGYDILSRDHISSRIWNAAAADPGTTTAAKGGSKNHFNGDGGGGWFGGVQLSQNNHKNDNNNDDGNKYNGSLVSSFILPNSFPSPVFVGSVGCNADCEELKRTIQMDLRSGMYFGELSGGSTTATTSKLSVDQLATLLGQVLYSRRTFPYYAFCIVVGINDEDDDQLQQGGQVYVYDAIGSYEQVAVASTGTGRELLQPILDRKFRTLMNKNKNNPKGGTTMLTTTVPTLIDCQEPQEAIDIVVDAYRSVSEREIGVGDNVVVVCLRRRKRTRTRTRQEEEDDDDSNNQNILECNVYKYPLKKH